MDSSDDIHPAIRGLKTVCRCNNIKYRTIERAIREGAWTLSQVAERTGATTGHCGGTCTPDIQQMLAELAPKHASQPLSTKSPSQTPAVGTAPAAANQWWVKKK